MTAQIFTSDAVYILFNGHFGTVMEFYPLTGLVQAGHFNVNKPSSCQQWEFIPAEDGFIVRCSGRAEDSNRVYLNFEGDLRAGEPLRASSYPMVWHVTRDRGSDMIRLLFSNKFCVDLDNSRQSKIQLWSFRSDLQSELWYPSRRNLESFLQESAVDARDESWLGDTTTNDAQPHSASPGAPVPGALVLVNVKSDTVLSLACSTNLGKPIECKCYSKADTHKQHFNQLWTFVPSGAGFAVQSGMMTADGQALYLTIEGPAAANAAIVVKPYPTSWEVRRYETDRTETIGYRVYWPGTNLLVALEKEGSKAEGTP
ncbi:hypothetical protein TRAPUB_12735, partial [Trametes pubescens]